MKNIRVFSIYLFASFFVLSSIIGQQTIEFQLSDFMNNADSPCTYTYENLTMEIQKYDFSNGSSTLYCEDEFPSSSCSDCLIESVTLEGALILPGGSIEIEETVGVCTAIARLFSDGEEIASQTLTQFSTMTNSCVSNPLTYVNTTSSVIDQIIIEDIEIGIFEGEWGIPEQDRKFKFKIETPHLSFEHYYNQGSTETHLKESAFYADDEVIFGVCADGTFSSTFYLFYDSNIENFDIRNLNWQLRIKQDPNTEDKERYGIFNYITNLSEENWLTFTYQSPEYLVSANQSNLQIEVYNTQTDYVIDEFSLKIYRTPILMVHGLWGNKSSFNIMYNRLNNTNEYKEFQLSRCDYGNSNDEEFEVNRDVVRNCISSKDGLINSVLKKKIAVSKVDIIAHSMGGILSRLYIQSANYKNDVNKIITLNTPHSGSQLANLIFDPDFSQGSERFCFFLRFIIRYGRCDEGAVNDLRIDSEAIGNLYTTNQPPIAKHTITSPINYSSIPYQLRNVIEDEFMLDAMLFAALFGGELNDAIVTQSSQRGGLPDHATTSFLEILHTETPKDENVFNTIKALLSESPESSGFTKNAYTQVSQSYNPTASNDETVELMAIEIIQPEEGAVFMAGDEIMIEVSAPNEVSRTVVFFQNQPGSFPEAFEINGNQGTAIFEISKSLLGMRRIGVMGYGNNGSIARYLSIYLLIQMNYQKNY